MMSEGPGRMLVDAAGVAGAIDRLAAGLAAALDGAGPVFLAGIPTRGVALAARLAQALRARGLPCECGAVDISMHRDDLGLRGGVSPLRGTDLPMDLEERTVVLVDDVQHTGRTARAALEAVLAYGRPRRILYAVLADRGGRELPVRPDFTGIELAASAASRVLVRLEGTDAEGDGIYES